MTLWKLRHWQSTQQAQVRGCTRPSHCFCQQWTLSRRLDMQMQTASANQEDRRHITTRLVAPKVPSYLVGKVEELKWVWENLFKTTAENSEVGSKSKSDEPKMRYQKKQAWKTRTWSRPHVTPWPTVPKESYCCGWWSPSCSVEWCGNLWP